MAKISKQYSCDVTSVKLKQLPNIMENETRIRIDDNTTSYLETEVGRMLGVIVEPILLVFGTIGNCLAMIVWSTSQMRSSTGLYLTVLAAADTVALYAGLLRQWVIYLFKLDFRDLSTIGCKVDTWLVYSSVDISAWIVASVTIERAISVWRPLHARILCTRKRAFVSLSTICVFSVLLNSHFLYGYELKNNGEGLLKCLERNESYRHFIYNQWTWIDLCVYCLIPSTIIIIGNFLILCQLLKTDSNLLTENDAQTERNQNNNTVVCNIGTPSCRAQLEQVVGRHVGITEGVTNNRSLDRSLDSGRSGRKLSAPTATLLAVNIVFLSTTAPVSIYLIGLDHWLTGADAQERAILNLWWSIVFNLMYTNHSVNFYMYCLGGTKFRRQLTALFGRKTTSSAQQTWDPQTSSSVELLVQCISGNFRNGNT